MGYTHYFTPVSKEIAPEVVATFKEHYYAMVKSTRAAIVTDKDTPNELWFNGVGDDAHETMCFDFDGRGSWGFCKTAYKPYDALVVATLILAKEMGIIEEWSSDGDSADHQKGKVLLKRIKAKLLTAE